MRNLALMLLLIPNLLSAQSGTLLVVGGGTESNDYPESWSTQAYSWAVEQAPNKKVAVIHYDDTGDWLRPYFTDHCGAEDSKNFVINSSNANNQSTIDELMEYDMFFFRGGDQYYYYTDYNGTLMEQAMKDKFNEGGVLAGTSAGLAVLSEVIFWAENGSAYSDVTLKNIEHSSISLADDFMDVAPGFIFDSHFVNRGRMGRLVSFMANYEKETGKRITGIGVDETTALAIKGDLGIAFGTHSVNFYRLPESEDFGEGPLLTARNIEVHQLVHGDSINLETHEISGLSEAIEPTQQGIYADQTIFLSGSEELSSTNKAMLSSFLEEGNGKHAKILILTGNEQGLASDVKNQLELAGASDVHIGEAIYDNVADAALLGHLESAEKFIFTGSSMYNLNVFIVSGHNGKVLKERLQEPGLNIAFIGDNARMASPWLVNNYFSGRTNLSMAEALGLLDNTCIIPRTFDPPGGSTDNWYSTNLSVPFALVNKKLQYGIWLNNDNYIVYRPDGTTGTIYTYGNSPVMVMEMKSGNAEFTAMTYNGQLWENPLPVAGFDNMSLSFLGNGESMVVSTAVSSSSPKNESGEIQLFPNPASDHISVRTSQPMNELSIVNIDGKLLYNKRLSSSYHRLDIGFLHEGMYFLNIRSGHESTIHKFFKSGN